MSTKSPSIRQRGVSLIELIMFIVIISVALAGILLVMNVTMRSSADPVVHKQALAIAESLLEEVELMPFTYCDPDDASAVTAAGPYVGGTPPGCNATIEGQGPETIGGVKEDRYGGANPTAVNAYFDNVNDYDGFNMAAVLDMNKNSTVNGYSASIAVTPTALGAIASTESLLVTVKVTGPDGLAIQLDGYRTRYAPNTGP